MIEIPETRTSYWIDSTHSNNYPSLEGEVVVDVAIIGAGIVGLTSAYLLKKAGYTVAVVEKDTVGSGVSGYTTGKISSQHNLIYAKLAQRLGKETAQLYGEANQAALAQIAAIIEHEKIDCDWHRKDNYVYTTDPSKVKQFRDEADIAAACGLPATFETSSDLPFQIQAAVKFSDQATFHVRKYLIALANIINGEGSYIYEHSKVTSINSGTPPRISTLKGKVYADDIIVATNVPTFPLVARGTYAAAEYPQQSYIVAGRPNHTVEGMYISPDKNHYSILPVHSKHDNLLLIGGEAHIPGTRWNANTRYKRLADYARENFGITEITYQWSHRDYLGYDDMPLIGLLYPWSRNIYTATGFMKWGLTNGTAAAMILTDTIQGDHNRWAHIFNPHRLTTVSSIPKVIREHIGL